MKILGLIIGLFFYVAGLAQEARPAQGLAQPVFQVDVPDPTADKPQSKLWFADGSWWVVLPRLGGPSLWQRTASGWKEHVEVAKALSGVPGRADVWAGVPAAGGSGMEATAVGVSKDSLVVFRLSATQPNAEWNARSMGVLKPPVREDIETATIVRDGRGEWWVAADGNTSIYVWHSVDGFRWSPAIPLKKGVNKDDICLISAVRGGVLVTWSNQTDEAVQCRLHRDGHGETDWEKEENVLAGNKTADDHLHSALGADGSLWMVTKNSVDSNDYPQLVLRVRSAAGVWRNFPYAPRTAVAEPSRPVILATPRAGVFLAGHTIYDKTGKFKDRIEWGRLDTAAAGILVNRQVVIPANAGLSARINNCTVPRFGVPAGAPWIILASDEKGRVYEADLSRFSF